MIEITEARKSCSHCHRPVAIKVKNFKGEYIEIIAQCKDCGEFVSFEIGSLEKEVKETKTK